MAGRMQLNEREQQVLRICHEQGFLIKPVEYIKLRNVLMAKGQLTPEQVEQCNLVGKAVLAAGFSLEQKGDMPNV